MLSYALAIAVATSSLVLFLTAFLMSDIHRKDDFLWSGVGLFYALVLWYCARNITGAVLLGQAAATALLVSYSWQTLKLRRAIANPDKAAEINNFSVLQKVNGLLKRKQPTVQPTAPSAETPITPKVTEQEIAIPDTPVKDSVPTPAPNPAPTTEAPTAKPPVIETAIEDKAVKTDSLPESEAKESSDKDKPDNQTPIVEPISQPTEAATSTQVTEIVESQPVEPVVVRDNRQDNADSAKNTETKAALPSEPKAEPKKPAPATGDRQAVESPDTEVKAESPTTSETVSGNTEVKSESPTIKPVFENPEVKAESPTTSETAEPDDTKVKAESPKTSEIVKPAKAEPATKKSALDSLETVEVAEVLEAEEDSTIDLDTDRSNIIEVTTTEINITTEVTTLEQKPEEDSDSQEK